MLKSQILRKVARTIGKMGDFYPIWNAYGQSLYQLRNFQLRPQSEPPQIKWRQHRDLVRKHLCKKQQVSSHHLKDEIICRVAQSIANPLRPFSLPILIHGFTSQFYSDS